MSLSSAAGEKDLQQKEAKLMELQEFYETQLLQHKVHPLCIVVAIIIIIIIIIITISTYIIVFFIYFFFFSSSFKFSSN